MSTASPVSLVTGANRGIGRETARQLAALGHTVLLCARRLEDAEQAVADLAPGVPGTLLPYRLDVTDADDVITLARNVEKEFGLLDILVNNAAISSSTTPPSTTTPPSAPSSPTSTRSGAPWRPTSSVPGEPRRRSCRCCAAHPTPAW
jgi:NAD(P)-dependent dehydrogenase (short-subunit alcohol dehydrogenase family)